MKSVLYRRHGRPADVCELVDLPRPIPGPGQVRVRVQASPVDPADLLVLHGLYAVQPPLPATPGMEGTGVVDALGPGVADLVPGQPVLLPIRAGAWREEVVVDAATVLPLPAGIDPVQASMLRINPPTAELLLTEVVPLRAGSWVLQNPGSGSVGQLVIQRAKAHGLRTVSVVRRPDRIGALQELGADVVLEDGDDLHERVAVATGGAPLGLALDAVGGDATHRLARCLNPGGTVVSYGAVSRQRAALGVDQSVFRGITLRGFWLFQWNGARGGPVVTELLARLATAVAGGDLRTQVAAVYDLHDVREALQHARSGEGFGRVVLRPA